MEIPVRQSTLPHALAYSGAGGGIRSLDSWYGQSPCFLPHGDNIPTTTAAESPFSGRMVANALNLAVLVSPRGEEARCLLWSRLLNGVLIAVA